jgi:hypothetical protein
LFDSLQNLAQVEEDEMRFQNLLILMLTLLLVVACGGTATEVALPTPVVEESMAEDVSTPTDEPTPEPPSPTPTPLPEEPTDTPEPEPTEAPANTPTPVEEPTETTEPTFTLEPQPESTDTPEPEPVVQVSGTGGFRNNLATADQFVLNLTGVSAPPEGQAYQGWLVATDGSTISVGLLAVNADGTVALQWNSPATENLLNRYGRFQATLEPAAGSDNPTGPIVFAGELEPGVLDSAQRLFVKNQGEPATPLDTAFVPGMIAQTDVGIQHVQNAVNAAAIGALPETRIHLEHVVNIFEGAAGPRFGDHDGNGNAENPGDGFGVVGYVGQITTLLGSRPAVGEAAASVQAQVVAIQDKSLEILPLDDMAAVNAQLAELKSMADQLKAGPVADLNQAAQNGFTFDVSPVE